jgi:two-component system, cell cycle response regulator
VRLLPPERYSELKATGRLPSPRGVAVAIIRLMQKDEFPVGDLVRLVQSDPAISGRLLKYANAAAFGRSRPVVSLHRAIVALGSFRVRDLVIGFSVLQANRSGECPSFDYNGFWSRSLATAIACQDLAAYAQIASEENFTIGLLSRVGELGFATLFPADYATVLDAASDPFTLLALEDEKFGFDHRVLGGSMLAEWGLPDILIRATFHHEIPDEAGLADGSRLQTIALTLHFARSLAEVCVAEDEGRWSLLPTLVNRSARLGIDPATLGGMVDSIVARWRDWGAILQVRTRDMPPFAELLAASPPRPVLPDHEGSPVAHTLTVIAADTPDTLALASTLTDLGYRTSVISDPGAAVEGSLADPPAMVVLDLDLPDLDAMGCCQSLRQDPLGSKTYVLVVASAERESAALAVLEAGADDVLLKPLTAQNLRLRLNLARRMLQLRQEMLREREDVVRSASKFADSYRRLIQVALTDPLTQLPNRRHGLDFLNAEWEGAKNNNLPLSAMMLDIDHFKRVNDNHGHAAGDAVLRALAELLRNVSRTEDMVFRYGGEEFAIILPGTTLATAVKVAERIRRLVAVETFKWQASIIPITISIGVAALAGSGGDSTTLMEAADAALYQAKEGGRNRVMAARTR